MNHDDWYWEATLIGGKTVTEHQIGSIHNLDAPLVEKLSVVKQGGRGRVTVSMSSGDGFVGGAHRIRPLNPEYGPMAKVPVFFRRKKRLNNLTTVEFRAVGYAVYHERGELMSVCVLRVFRAAIDRRFYASWSDPSQVAVHSARQSLLLKP
ncbi:MAG: hypothetical protein ACI88C_000038 [Acidimicrobiales bacterium]|jgi:hypothetical protein